MSKSKTIGFFTIILTSFLFWASYSIFAMADNAQGTNDLVSIYSVVHPSKPGAEIPASVYINENKVITFYEKAGGLTPKERVRFLVLKLNTFVKENKDPAKIFPDTKNNTAIGRYGTEILFTADEINAKKAGLNSSDLALLWVNNIRKAFGAKELVRDYELIRILSEGYASSDSLLNSYAEFSQTGMASWYGGHFNGRRTASGRKYNVTEFTAAHKSLPFGSVVKVTNLRNGSSCVVKINDRGPFVKGRIIDLSKVAAKEIGILSSGVSKVKIEVLGKV